MGRTPKKLPGLPVERMPFEKRVVFFLFQAPRSIRTLFVPGAHVTGGRFAFSFRFGAFQSDDVTGHNLMSDCSVASGLLRRIFSGLWLSQFTLSCLA
jgi:hypothetical protein